MSRRTDDKDQLKFFNGETGGRNRFWTSVRTKDHQDGGSDTKNEQQQRGAGADRFRPKSRRSRLQTGSEGTTPRFIVVKCEKSKSSVHRTTKRTEKTTVEEEESPAKQTRVSRLVTSRCTAKGILQIVKWEEPARNTGIAS